jgi:uncharacterized membrane protein required for colicin V production
VSVTCLTINYAHDAGGVLEPLVSRMNPVVARWVTFWVLFVCLALITYLLIRRLTDVIKWERLHWTIQGMAVVIGGARGVWWSALFLVACATSGFDYLHESATARSVIGSRWSPAAHELLSSVAAIYPQSAHRPAELIPPARVVAKTKHKKK